MDIQYNSANPDWSGMDAELQNLSISTFKFDYHYKFPENLTFFKTLILSETLLILNLTTISPSLEITRNGLTSIEPMVAVH